MNTKHCGVVLGIAMMLAACTGTEVRSTLGLNRRSPDAFNVVARPPLTVPKEFVLPEPHLPYDRASAIAAEERARALLSGTTTEAAAPAAQPTTTAADQGLMEKVGAHAADTQVKQKMQEEAWQQQQAEENKGLLDEFRDGLGSVGANSADQALDAQKEAQELKQKNIPVKMPAQE